MKPLSPTRIYELTEFGKLCKLGRSSMGGMTRFDMAKALGVTSKEISDIESGKTLPSKKYVKAATGLLGLCPVKVEASLKASEHESHFDNVIPFPQRLV